MIRKGRKPKPRNEEEMLQQIEERAASKLREAEHRNALKRAKRIHKLNMGPGLGAAKQPSQKKAKIQKNQLKPKDQQTSQLKPKANLNSSTIGQEDSCDKFLGDIEQAPVDHSSASNNINPLLESKESAIQQLREKLKEELIASELEALGDSLIFEKKEKKKRKSEEKDLDLLWTDKEALAFKAFELHHGCKAFSCKNCGNEGSEIVNCIDCNQIICGKCDEDIHLQNPFHQRSLYSKTRPGKQLLPTEFLDHKGQIVVKRVVLPLCSPKCDNCETSMSQNSRSVMHAVITPKGRFNLHKTSFHCENCSITREPEFSDFIVSGYFPGSPISTKYLFSFELLRMWRHFKYLTPGTSEFKFLEIILAISTDLGRVSIGFMYLLILRRKTIPASSASLTDLSVSIGKVSVTTTAPVPATRRKTIPATSVFLEAPTVAIGNMSVTETAPVPATGRKTIPATSVFLADPSVAIGKESVAATARVPATGRKTIPATSVFLADPSVAIGKESVAATAQVPASRSKMIPASSACLAAPSVANEKVSVSASAPFPAGMKTFPASLDQNIAASVSLTPPAFAITMRKTATARGLVADAGKTITSSTEYVAVSAPLSVPTVAIRKKTVTALDPVAGSKEIPASLASLTIPTVAIEKMTVTAPHPVAGSKAIPASSASLVDPSVANGKVSVSAAVLVSAVGRKTSPVSCDSAAGKNADAAKKNTLPVVPTTVAESVAHSSPSEKEAAELSKKPIIVTKRKRSIRTRTDEEYSIGLCDFQLCSKPNQDMVGCDICDRWFHFRCVKIKKGEYKDQPYLCSVCK